MLTAASSHARVLKALQVQALANGLLLPVTLNIRNMSRCSQIFKISGQCSAKAAILQVCESFRRRQARSHPSLVMGNAQHFCTSSRDRLLSNVNTQSPGTLVAVEFYLNLVKQFFR